VVTIITIPIDVMEKRMLGHIEVHRVQAELALITMLEEIAANGPESAARWRNIFTIFRRGVVVVSGSRRSVARSLAGRSFALNSLFVVKSVPSL
jgi:hypothetical protein